MDAAVHANAPALPANAGTESILAMGRWLCVIALIFASGDVWPTVTVGFTFRLSQLCILLALALYLTCMQNRTIRLFPGLPWLYAFVVWLIVSLPFSLYFERSLGYTFWALLNALTVFAFVQFFRTEAQLIKLVRYFLISFIAIAVFGVAQFLLGVIGIDILITQWWIDGRLPRINGLSYEPSYFATYTLVGWVLSVYLIEKRAPVPGRRLQWVAVWTTSVALVLSTSRMGWLLMLVWVAFRVSTIALGAFLRGRFSRRAPVFASTLPILAGLAVIVLLPFAPRLKQVFDALSFLLAGIGLADESTHSSAPRLDALMLTWRAFLNYPITGTGIGAVSVDIAAQSGSAVLTLADAKAYEGMAVLVELLASTGLVGALLMLGFVVAIVRRYRVVRAQVAPWRKILLSGLAWSIIWLLIALQLNQNFLRIYLYTDIAVLLCCLLATKGTAVRGLSQSPREPDRIIPALRSNATQAGELSRG